MSAQHALQEETQAVLEGGSLLDRIIDESRIARSSAEHERARDLIGELVEQVLEGELVPSENLSASLDARVAELDALISAQLSEILHAPEFQRLEAHGAACITCAGKPPPARISRSGCSMPASVNCSGLQAGDRLRSECLVQEGFEEGSALSGLALRCIDWRVHSRANPRTCISSSRCRTSRPLPTRRSLLRHRRSCLDSRALPSLAVRAI